VISNVNSDLKCCYSNFPHAYIDPTWHDRILTGDIHRIVLIPNWRSRSFCGSQCLIGEMSGFGFQNNGMYDDVRRWNCELNKESISCFSRGNIRRNSGPKRTGDSW
jgi:hypothetical protein